MQLGSLPDEQPRNGILKCYATLVPKGIAELSRHGRSTDLHQCLDTIDYENKRVLDEYFR